MMPLLKQGKHKQLPERHSSGTQQPQQNIKSNLKSHVKKKKKTNKIKLWFFPLTFSYQNPQSHYVYGSLCSSFFLQQSFDWQLLGSYCNLIYLSSLWSFCFVSSFNCFYTKGKKNIHFLLLFLLSFFFFLNPGQLCIYLFTFPNSTISGKKVIYSRGWKARELGSNYLFFNENGKTSKGGGIFPLTCAFVTY